MRACETPERQVVADFERAGDKERDSGDRYCKCDSSEEGSDRGADASRNVSDTPGGGSFVRFDDGHYVSLASRHVHLGQAESSK